MKKSVIIIFFLMYSLICVGQKLPLVQFKILIPDTLHFSECPEIFQIEAKNLSDTLIEIGNPKYLYNCSFYSRTHDDICGRAGESPEKLLEFVKIEKGETINIEKRFNHISACMRPGEKTINLLYSGMIKYKGEIIHTIIDLYEQVHYCCEPKTIFIVDD